jgi:hypothetical protein
MQGVEILKWPEIPQELTDKLIAVLKEKLPVQVDDAILIDITNTQNKVIEEYLRNLKS